MSLEGSSLEGRRKGPLAIAVDIYLPNFIFVFISIITLGLEFGFLRNGFRILTGPGQTEACQEPAKRLGSGW